MAEVLVLSLIRDGVGYPVDKERGTRRNQRRDDRRGNGRDDDLAGNGGPLHASRTHRSEGGTNKATEQGVGGTGRHTQQPGEQVPDDAADKASEDDHQQCLAVGISGGARQVVGIKVNNAFCDGRSNIDRKEGTHKVKHCGDGYRSKRLQSTGGNGRSHRVGSVMKSVRKVKGKGGHHHNAEDNQSRCHSVGPLERKDEHGTHLRRLHTSRTKCRLLLRLSTDNCFSLIFPLVNLLLTCWDSESSPRGFQRDKISPANAN